MIDQLLTAGAATRITRYITIENGGKPIRDKVAHYGAAATDFIQCPFCVGTWIHIATQLANTALPQTGPWRTAWRATIAGLTAAWIAGHVAIQLGDTNDENQ